MKNTTKKGLLSITAAFLDFIEFLGKRYDAQTIHLNSQIVVSVELIFSGNLEMLIVRYRVFDTKTSLVEEIGAYDEELITKLQHIKENGIER